MHYPIHLTQWTLPQKHMLFMQTHVHADCATVVPTQEGWAESVGMQGCDGVFMSGPESFLLGHLPRHHSCWVHNNGSVMGCSTAASHGTLVGVDRLHLHHRQERASVVLQTAVTVACTKAAAVGVMITVIFSTVFGAVHA